MRNYNNTQPKLAMNSRTFIWNTSNATFWIRKNNALLNLIDYQPDIDKVDLFTKDPY